MTAADLIDRARIHEPFAVVHLIDRRHAAYYGPVWRVADRRYICYDNQPVEVFHRHANEYEERR